MRESFPSPAELQGALQGTLLYLALYCGFLQFQSYSKLYLIARKKKEAKKKEGSGKVSFRDTKYYNSRDALALAGDRTVGNFLEQAILFLPLMWLHALFVDPTQSFTICAWYTFFRSYYPIAFWLSKNPPSAILFSTLPGYAIVIFLLAQLSSKAAFV